MKRKMIIVITAMAACTFLTSGCATAPKKYTEEVQGLKARVETLESRVEGVESKANELERATGEQAQSIAEVKYKSTRGRSRTSVSTREGGAVSRATVKDIQACLKKAGFYSGKVDGVKGKSTKRAIRSFQKANGLTADGVVGARTWDLLSRYR